MGDSDASNLCPLKCMFFFLFLYLHHPNLENIFIFYLPLFNSIAKNLFQGIKNIEGAFAPLAPSVLPLCWHVVMYVFICTYICVEIYACIHNFAYLYTGTYTTVPCFDT